jgi:uncharacterized membrane protein YtjA (UPF0391 family)
MEVVWGELKGRGMWVLTTLRAQPCLYGELCVVFGVCAVVREAARGLGGERVATAASGSQVLFNMVLLCLLIWDLLCSHLMRSNMI